MYYDIGEDKAVLHDDFIGVFDIDATTVSSRTRDYLNKCEKEGLLEIISTDIPLSFVVTTKKVYLSSVSSKTIYSRTNR